MPFTAMTAGIVSLEQKGREQWKEHIQGCHRMILDAARMVPTPKTVMLLGAGYGFDIPLEQLLDGFDHVVLVDIDKQALERCVSRVSSSAKKAKCEIRVRDVAGICSQVAEKTGAILSKARNETEAHNKLIELMESYHLNGVNSFSEPGEQIDLAVSGMILTQITYFTVAFISQAFAKTYPKHQALLNGLPWQIALSRLGLSLQQDHINALCQTAPLTVLTSDKYERYLQLEYPTKRPVFTSKELPMIGAQFLRHRVPGLAKILKEASWQWWRDVPDSFTQGGAMMGVDSLILATR